MPREYDLVIEGQSYHVEVERSGAGRARVVVDGDAYEVEIESMGGAAPQATAWDAGPAAPAPAAPVAAPSPAPAVAAGGGHAITAPMPGLVLEVKVTPGAKVTAGQVVLRLEAMKMENDIKSPVAGTVSQVPVRANDEVGVGQLLVEIAPE